MVPVFVCVRSRQPFREHPDCFVFVPGQASHQLTWYTPGTVNVNAAVDVDRHEAPFSRIFRSMATASISAVRTFQRALT